MKIHRSYRLLGLTVGLIIVAGLALTWAVEYTSRSSFCLNCHEMKPISDTWKSSTHSSVECIKCHADPGVVGLLTTKAQALKEVYRHFTNTYHKPITIDSDTRAFSTRCLRCHEDIIGRGKPHNPRHFAKDVSCADCHLGLVHNAGKNKKPPSRQVCIKCHGGVISD